MRGTEVFLGASGGPSGSSFLAGGGGGTSSFLDAPNNLFILKFLLYNPMLIALNRIFYLFYTYPTHAQFLALWLF